MNNVIKFLIYLLVVLLLVSWLITVGKSCTSSNKSKEHSTAAMVDRADSARDLMEELEDDTADFSQELESILDEEEASAQNELEEIDYSSYDPKTDVIEEEPEPEPVAEKKPEKKQVTTKPSSTSGSGTFLVVAGSYLHPDNANKQRDKLVSLGYDGEVVSFELSEYHSVLAGRFNDYDDAQKIVNQLSGDGVAAYVKKRTR